MGFANQDVESVELLRTMVRSQLQLMVTMPGTQLAVRVEETVNWIIQKISDSPHDLKVFGLSPAQIFHCKAYYEAKTGKKAEEI